MSRVWIYQADRKLDAGVVSFLENDLESFVANWTAHGSALYAKGYIKDNLFLILEVDESVAGVTGCSIDKSVHFIKSLGERYAIDFFDRMRVAYIDENNMVQIADRSEFENLIKLGSITADTIVFNNLITSSEELQDKWQVAFKDSWHAKIFA